MIEQQRLELQRFELIKTQLEIDRRWLSDIPIANAIIERYTKLIESHLDDFGPQPANILRLRLISMIPADTIPVTPPILEGAQNVNL